MKLYRHFTLAALILCVVVIVFGAYVRLSDAGLGCPDWPGCYGHLTVPEAAHEVDRAQQSFPQRPVETHKAWKEMIHRYLASTLGFIILSLALWSLFSRDERLPRKLPWLLLGLVIFQGMLGMWTVTWQLKPLAVCGHLLGGMTLASLLLWSWLTLGDRLKWPRESEEAAPSRFARNERQAWAQMQDETPEAGEDWAPDWLVKLASMGLIVVALQIFLGGWTSSNYAALACPDLPMCHGQWLPPTDFKEAFTLWRGLGINYEYGVLDSRARVTIHFTHRVGAVVVTAVLSLLALCLLLRKRFRRWGQAVFGALALQVAIGLSIVKLQLPLLLADMHNAGAAILLLTLVAVNYELRQPSDA